MSQTQPPPPKPVLPASPPQRDVPVWLFALVILLCVAGGGAFMWWFFSSKPATVTQVKLKDEVVAERQGAGTAAQQPERARRQPRNRREFPPLPQGEIPAGTRVTKKWDAAPLEQVLSDLPKVGNVAVALQQGGPKDKKITYDAADQPLWTVLAEVSKQANLQVQSNHDRGGQILLGSSSGTAQRPSAVSGPFLLRLDNISNTISYRLGGDQKPSQHVQMQFSLFVEPGTPLLGAVRQITLEEAIDQAGTDISKANVFYGNDASPLENRWWTSVYASVTPTSESRRLATFRGYVTVLISEKQESFEIEDPANNRNKAMTIDGLRVRLRNYKETDERYEVQLEIAGHSNDPAVRHRFAASERMRLLDFKGKPFDSRGSSSSGGEPYVITRYFGKSASRVPAKIVLQVPTGLKEIRIPFAFNDLPLPY